MLNSTEVGLSAREQELIQSLCEKSHTKIRNAAHRYLDDISPTLVDDVEQETFLRACLYVNEVLSHPKPEGWIVKTAINVARSIRRRELAIRKLEKNITADDMIEDRSKLEDCIPNTLRAEDRDILIRYYEDRDDIKEIAQDLKMEEGAIKKRLARARTRFKEKLSKKK